MSQFYNLPQDQIIKVSPNSQTLNKLSLAQLKHFNTYTKACSVGAHQLLIIDSYKSYNLHKFYKYCKEEKIIVLYIPPYLFYLLQLLNIGCFSPLKQVYSNEISSLAQYSTKQIKKKAFLLAFKVAFKKAIIKKNIYVGFRGARLVLYNLKAVILRLNIVLCTLTLLKLEDTLQELKILSNLYKVEA